MKNLILIGANDWGLEVYSWLNNAIGFNSKWIFKGFLDDNEKIFNQRPVFAPLFLSTIKEYCPEKNDVFVCTIANPEVKARVIEQLKNKNISYVNVIHKSVCFYSDNLSLGLGCIIAPNTVISTDVKIGNHVGINIACAIGHNVEIGDFSQLSSHNDLTGFVKLGRKVFIGSSACFIPHVSIGDLSTIGAGSVVIRNVRDGVTVFGNPAKVIKKSLKD